MASEWWQNTYSPTTHRSLGFIVRSIRLAHVFHSRTTLEQFFTSENERDKVIAKRKKRSERERAKRRRDKLLGNAQSNGLYQSNTVLNLIGDTSEQSHTPVDRHPSRKLEENEDKSSSNTPLEISALHVRRKTPHQRKEAPRRDEYFYLETVTFQVILVFSSW